MQRALQYMGAVLRRANIQCKVLSTRCTPESNEVWNLGRTCRTSQSRRYWILAMSVLADSVQAVLIDARCS